MSKEFIEKKTQSTSFMKRCSISPLIKDTNQYVKVPFLNYEIWANIFFRSGGGRTLSHTAVRNVNR